MFSLSISLRDGVLCASMKHMCHFFNPADSSEFFPQCFKLAEDSRISRIAAGHEPQHPAPGLQSEVGVCDSEILCNARGEAQSDERRRRTVMEVEDGLQPAGFLLMNAQDGFLIDLIKSNMH